MPRVTFSVADAKLTAVGLNSGHLRAYSLPDGPTRSKPRQGVRVGIAGTYQGQMTRMIKTRHFLAPLLMSLTVVGCARSVPVNDMPVQPPGIEPLPTAADDGLTERKPDLCKASTYASYIGQPGGVVPTLGITKEYRIVEYRGIEPQEYNPNRIVFRLDSTGNISGVDCG